MSWHHHHLLCGRPEMLPANNISDWCATVDKVLHSLAMPTSVHDDTKLMPITQFSDMQHIMVTALFSVGKCIISGVAQNSVYGIDAVQTAEQATTVHMWEIHVSSSRRRSASPTDQWTLSAPPCTHHTGSVQQHTTFVHITQEDLYNNTQHLYTLHAITQD